MRETGGGGALRRGNMAAAGELAARAASERVVAGTTGFRVLSTGERYFQREYGKL